MYIRYTREVGLRDDRISVTHVVPKSMPTTNFTLADLGGGIVMAFRVIA